MRISPTELRIGNYYIDEDGEQHTFDWGVMGWMDWDYCSAIPLTEEWLLKFGFENTSSSGTEYYDKDKLVICQDDGLDYIEDLTNVNIKHVHQLQNLYFALTGEELTLQP